jgi:hypothetical protein
MALKQVVDTTKNTFLAKRFEDDDGNQYSDAASKSLVAWYRFTSTAPTNLSTNKFYDDESTPVLIDVGATYGASAAAPALSTIKIGEIFYNTATFGADASDQVNIGTAVEWDHIIGNESSSTKKMTLSAWIYKTGDGGSSLGRIFDFGKDTILSTDSDEKVRFSVLLNNADVRWDTGANSFALNAWTHIVVSYDASVSITNDPKIYINGKLVDVTLASGSKHATYSGITTHDCFIGNKSGADRAFAGSIAEACVWNQLLTSENIKAMYNVSQTRFTRNQTVSGFLGNSPRIRSVENLNYHDVHGMFDDTRTVNYIDPRQSATIKLSRVPRDTHTVTITDSVGSKQKVFEFQNSASITAGNIEVNTRDTSTPAQVARKLVSAINSQTNPDSWTFHAEQIEPSVIKITRGKIDTASACTISTSASERFVKITSVFKKKPQPISVYPSLEIAGSTHLLERKNIGGSMRSDIQIVRPVAKIESTRPKKVTAADPYNESHSHSAFGFEEGLESVSPERDMNSDFYVSGSASVISPASVKSRKKIVVDMPVSINTDLQLVTDALGEPRSNTSANFPMAYYNFSDQRWEPIGLGSGSFYQTPGGTATQRLQNLTASLDFTMVGFTPSRGLKAYKTSNSGNTAQGFEKLGLFDASPSNAFAFKSASGATYPKVINVGSLASPTNVFGFPAHPKFHATGSQELVMSSRIKRPFVLEKIVYEFNVGSPTTQTQGTLSTDVTDDSSLDLDTITFFMLNQRVAAVGSELSSTPIIRVADGGSPSQKGKLEEFVNISNPIGAIPRKIQLTPHGGDYPASVLETEVSTIRDLVTWNRMTASPANFNNKLLDTGTKDVRKDSDLVINHSHANYPFGRINGDPKKYTISGECIAPVAQIASGSHAIGAAAIAEISTGKASFGVTYNSTTKVNTVDVTPEAHQSLSLSKNQIGRTLAGIQSGRSVKGENPTSNRMYSFRGLKTSDAKITAYEKDFGTSPYVILPTDKLIIGCQAPINAVLSSTDHGKIRLGAGEGRIILYGYELEKEKETFKDFNESSTGNSNFFTENIGETRVRDQFETNPRMTYYRSSIDEVVTGSMLSTTVGVDFNTQTQALARGVVGRNSQGTQGERGSLLRARKMQDQSERYYDSMIPDIANLMQADSVSSVDITGLRTSAILLGVKGSNDVYKSFSATGAGTDTKLIWDNWFSSFPFEPRYNSISTSRLEGTRKSIATKTQTGDTKASKFSSSIDHVALAIFEKTGSLGLVGMVNGTYTSTGVVDNPDESENINRLIPSGRSSSMFVNTPTLSNTDVYAAWSTQSMPSTGSIQILAALDTEAEVRALSMKTLTVPVLATGAETTISENFVFAFQDAKTDLITTSGKTKASIVPATIVINYSESSQVSDFSNVLLQLPTTGSADDSSGLKLFLDSGGLQSTGDGVVHASVDDTILTGDSKTNRGFLSALNPTDTVLSDRWNVGSLVQISKVESASGADIVNTSGATLTAGGVPANTPIFLFNDSAGSEARRLIYLDRPVNAYDSKDLNRTAISGSPAMVAPTNVMNLNFKHIKAVNTSVHSTLDEQPDNGEDIIVELSYGDPATTRIVATSGADDAGVTIKQSITLKSTDGTVRKYLITNSVGGGAATGTRLTSDSILVTAGGEITAGSENEGAVAVAIRPDIDNQNNLLAQLKAAIEDANGHNGKITVGDAPSPSATGSQNILLTQAVNGKLGNTDVTIDMTNFASGEFSGGACLSLGDGDTNADPGSGATNAVWGKTIDHSSMSRSEGFVTNDLKLGQSLRLRIATGGGDGFGQSNTYRVTSHGGGAESATAYTSTSKDVIRFTIRNTDQNGGVTSKAYQFFPVASNQYTIANTTLTYAENSIVNSRVITAVSGNTNQTGADFTYFVRTGKEFSGTNTDLSVNSTDQLKNARQIAQAINKVSELETGSGHVKGSFAAVARRDLTTAGGTYINIYCTSFEQGVAALNPPEFTDVDGSRSANAAIPEILVGTGRGDPLFVNIKQTAATMDDAYGFVDVKLKADLDPSSLYLKYDTAENANEAARKASIVSVNTANVTNTDQLFGEIAKAINITTAQNSSALRPMEGLIEATQDTTANTLTLTYNMPVRPSEGAPFKNKILLPLPETSYTTSGLDPSYASLTHRIIPVSDWTDGVSTPNHIAAKIDSAIDGAVLANSADSISWSPTIVTSTNTISLTQQGKGKQGDVSIATTAPNTHIATLGFGGGETSIYGDGDATTEPGDVSENSTASTVITCTGLSITNGDVITINIAGLTYSATINTGTSTTSSTVLGTNGSTSSNNLATVLKSSLDLFFATQITSGDVVVDILNATVTLKAKNKFYITATTPTVTVTGVGAGEPFTATDWSGADLIKITGAPLKKYSLQKGVFENDPEDIDTVHFASIQDPKIADESSNRVDSLSRVFEMGSDIDARTDYYSKVFFGSGVGPSKSPKYKLKERDNLTVNSDINVYSLIRHSGAVASVIGSNSGLLEKGINAFTLTGVATSSPSNAGSNLNFDVDDELLGFTGTSTRRVDLDTTIQSGETVYIRYAAMSFDSGVSTTSPSGTAPTLVTAEGFPAEKVESGDSSVVVKVSVDGGASYDDVHTLFTTTIDNVQSTDSNLFTANHDLNPVSTAKFAAGSDDTQSNHRIPGNVGVDYYPILKFVATSNIKLRLEQPSWSSMSSQYDHWWFRFLEIYVVGAGGSGGQNTVALSSRGNYNQTGTATDIEIRGAKYGLISPVKLNTSAIFRAGSFGNVRDMLEQRPLTRTFNGTDVSESAVAVAFQERVSKKPISPEETNSANLDLFCTSSLPYYDGLTKDRTSKQPDLLEEIDIDITV